MSARYDGTGDYSVSTLATYGSDTSISYSFWFRIPTGASLAQFDRIFECGGFNRSIGGPSITIDSPTTAILASYFDDGGASSDWGSHTYTLDTWHHCGITMNETANLFYFDGTPDSNQTRDGDPTGDRFTIAARNNAPAGNNDPQIDFAELAIWEGYILTQTNINTLYNSGSGAEATDVQSGSIVGYWPLRDDWDESTADSDTISNVGNAQIIAGHPFAAPASGIEILIPTGPRR